MDATNKKREQIFKIKRKIFNGKITHDNLTNFKVLRQNNHFIYTNYANDLLFSHSFPAFFGQSFENMEVSKGRLNLGKFQFYSACFFFRKETQKRVFEEFFFCKSILVFESPIRI